MSKTKILDKWLSLRDRKAHGKAPIHPKHTIVSGNFIHHMQGFFFIMCKAVSLEELNIMIEELNSKTVQKKSLVYHATLCYNASNILNRDFLPGDHGATRPDCQLWSRGSDSVDSLFPLCPSSLGHPSGLPKDEELSSCP